METKNINRITTAFINDKSPVMDLIHDDLIASGVDVSFRSDNVLDGSNQLSSLRTLPDICIIDLDFFDKGIMKQLRELRNQYPTLKLIAHSDMDDEKIIRELAELGISKYVLIGNDMKKAIDGVVND
ncbi:DNA-binding response regulator [Sphingobacterium hotanense]|uniref:DNA-binding response regulator n=1 Tax=Sphingobacterium hotanense TaxID=649196 RepID=UPI0021A39605|nr:DNA-binding response regulator [Sphingobacterium hotanense]MCT1524010.1 DNA-binding response regulator [Sphingobacterium hotanense]